MLFRTVGSLSWVSIGTVQRLAFGPFPPGTKIHSISVATGQYGTGLTSAFALAVFSQIPLTDAEFEAGALTDSLLVGSVSIDGGLGAAIAVEVPRDHFVELPLLAEIDESRCYVVVEGFAATDNSMMTFGLQVELPIVDASREADISVPHSVRAPSSAGRQSRGPRVLNRAAVPLPQQSFKGERLAPTPSLGR